LSWRGSWRGVVEGLGGGEGEGKGRGRVVWRGRQEVKMGVVLHDGVI
jgi:hypothetical protein